LNHGFEGLDEGVTRIDIDPRVFVGDEFFQDGGKLLEVSRFCQR
jgi:hypothetical protein